MLMPYLMDAMILFDEGTPAAVIDQAAIVFGMPMGPIELADVVGLDICLAVAKNLSEHLGEKLPARLVQMVKNGELGRKSGKGFYVYKNGQRNQVKVVANGTPLTEIANRLILRMINESVACLREEVVTDSDLLDAGMIFGTGFAPFRGGPIHYAEAVGLQNIFDQLQEFTRRYGKRFTPDAGWDNFLKKGSKKSVIS